MSDSTIMDTTESTTREFSSAAPRKRGRPLEMSISEVLDRIRALHSTSSLFRVHREQPALYARARRLFGTWGQALRTAGVDHQQALLDARRRSLETRRRARLEGRGREA